MLPSWATQTVTVVHPAMVDDRGTMVPDWSATPVSEVPVPGCSVQPGATAEVLAARQGSSIRWTVLAPPTLVATARDGVRFEGVLYQINGEPQPWPSPTGGLDHVVLFLETHEG